MRILLLLLVCAFNVNAVDHTFSYQGELTDGGSPASGTFNINIQAFDALSGGNLVGDLSSHTVTVTNGIFTIPDVNLGIATFDGLDVWLQISVKKPTDVSYTTLTPLQKMAAVPYATTLIDKGATNGQVLTFDNTTGWQPNTPTTGATNIDGLSDARVSGDSYYFGISSGQNDDGTNNHNAGFGYRSMVFTTTGEQNSAVGYNTLRSNETGSYNSAIGVYSMSENSTGSFNTALGGYSLYDNISGSRNTSVGYFAGRHNITGSGNVFLGNRAGRFETGDNTLYIENSETTTPLIGGDFSTDEVTINGSLGIVDGTQGAGKVFTSDTNGKGSWQVASGFDGAFSSLTGVPAGLADGDDDTQLTETQVDDFVANNGYVNTTDTTAWDKNAADDFSGAYADLSNAPWALNVNTVENSIGDSVTIRANTGFDALFVLGNQHNHSGSAAGVNVFYYEDGARKGAIGSMNQSGTNIAPDDFMLTTSFFNTGSLQLGTNYIARLSIVQDGKVGIGTLTPSELLDVNGNLKVSGNTSQNITSGGMVKYMVAPKCGQTGSVINRQFNGTTTAGAITIANGVTEGRCTLTFPTDINSRFWIASATIDANISANCVNNGTNKLNCRAFIPDTGAGVTAQITVIVY